MTRPVKEMSR